MPHQRRDTADQSADALDERDLASRPPLDERDAAQAINVSVHFLRASRTDPPRCDGPPFIRIGRAIRYRPIDLDRYLAARVVRPAAPDGRRVAAELDGTRDAADRRTRTRSRRR